MTITIGCTTKAGLFYRRALKEIGSELGADVQLADISGEERLHWERLDGLLIPGGPDINPCYYLPSIEKDLREHTKRMNRFVKYTSEGKRRDAFEHGALMEYFHNSALQDLPVLGICRGMQMLAVSQGIPLYVDIRQELGFTNPRLGLDRVETEKDSLIARMSEGESFLAPKLQHQAIRTEYYLDHRDRWPNLRLTAFSHEGKLAEAIEFKNRPVLGVQFHAEMTFGKVLHNIFQWLVKSAMERHRHMESNGRLYA